MVRRVQFPLPSLPDVKQVPHHPEECLRGADGAVVVCCHLVANEVLALLGCQLFASPEGVDVDKVVDVLAPAGIKFNKANMNMYLPCIHHNLTPGLGVSQLTVSRKLSKSRMNRLCLYIFFASYHASA